MRWVVAALFAALLVSMLSGCSSKDTGTSSSSSTTLTSTASTTTTTTTTTGSGKAAHLSADVRNGTAPLKVTFGIKVDGVPGKKWVVEFGDGAKAEGTNFPASANHTFAAAGTFLARLNVTYVSGAPTQDSLSIGVVPATGAAAGYHLHANSTVSSAAPANLCGEAAAADPAICWAKHAQSTHATTNGTFFRWYDIPVGPGSKALALQAGSQATQTCGGPACAPDFDLAIFDPAGTIVTVGTGADFEQFVAANPAAGTWSLAMLYFAGPPNAGTEAIIDVVM